MGRSQFTLKKPPTPRASTIAGSEAAAHANGDNGQAVNGTVSTGHQADSEKTCWRCGAGPQPPDLDTQVEMLRNTHYQMDEVWKWPPEEFQRLRALLKEGDVLLVIRNVFQMAQPSYAGVHVTHSDGSTEFIDRGRLQE